MLLTPKQVAPNFTATAINGTTVALESFRGKKTLLSFFRNGACALCNLRVHAMIQRYEHYQAQGMDFIAVFESALIDMTDEVGRQSAPFHILSDPDGSIHAMYGVENSAEKVQATMESPLLQASVEAALAIGFPLKPQPGSNFERIPADFLINRDLTIHTVHYGNLVFDHLPFESIDRFLADE